MAHLGQTPSELLEPYGDFRPTAFDCAGLALPDQQQWYKAPVSRTRDSGALDESNFETCLAACGGESDDCEVHRFGHWACGWFEIIIVRPGSDACLEAEKCAASLADYPVLDDDDWGAREMEEQALAWESNGIAFRVEACQSAGICIFAARRDEMPEDPNGALGEYLTGC